MTEQHVKDWVAECIVDDYVDVCHDYDMVKVCLQEFRDTLLTLIEAANKVRVLFLVDYTATEGNGLLDLDDVLERAGALVGSLDSAALPKERA